MTTRTRYFVIISLLVLTVGLGTGLLAYYVGFPTSAFSRQGGPDELQFVPADASLVAYANVHEIMTSDLRQKVRALMPMKEDGQREFENQTGISIEKDIDHVVAAVAPTHDASGAVPGSAIVLARGRFDEVKIEALMREHGAQVEQYKDQRIISGEPREGRPTVSLAFLQPGLVAVGTPTLVRAAVDLKAGGASVTTNDEVMNLVQDLDSGNAWAVGRFDVLASQAKLPSQISQSLPAIQWFSASAHIDSGLRAVIRAETRDEEAANALRDVIRGFMALAKLQVSSNPGFATVLRSLELGGAGKTVALSFEVPAEVFDTFGAFSPPSPPSVQPGQ